MTKKDIAVYRKLLAGARETRRHIRIIGVGQERVGKTTLCKTILQRSKEEIMRIKEDGPTEGIETHLYGATFQDGKITVEKLTCK